jgi:hypothetical protein
MTALILKPTGAYYGDEWPEDDYVVLDRGKVVGRIMLNSGVPHGRPWFWTITAREHPPSIHSRGNSATREQAMQDFKAQWLTKVNEA